MVKNKICATGKWMNELHSIDEYYASETYIEKLDDVVFESLKFNTYVSYPMFIRIVSCIDAEFLYTLDFDYDIIRCSHCNYMDDDKYLLSCDEARMDKPDDLDTMLYDFEDMISEIHRDLDFTIKCDYELFTRKFEGIFVVKKYGKRYFYNLNGDVFHILNKLIDDITIVGYDNFKTIMLNRPDGIGFNSLDDTTENCKMIEINETSNILSTIHFATNKYIINPEYFIEIVRKCDTNVILILDLDKDMFRCSYKKYSSDYVLPSCVEANMSNEKSVNYMVEAFDKTAF